MLLVCLPSCTGAFLIGTGFTVGTIGTQDSFGLVEVGVGGVFGLTIDDERMKPVEGEDFDSLAVSKIDWRRAGLTIS